MATTCLDPERLSQREWWLIGPLPYGDHEGFFREFPPERHPQEFERVRDAYAELRDPRERTRQRLFHGDPLPPLASLLDGKHAARRFAGPKPWLAVLKQP